MSLPSRLLGANPSIQVSTLLSGSLTTPSAKGAFTLPGDFESIATTVLSTANSTITFSSIPSTFTHLQLRILARTSQTSETDDFAGIRFNGDSGNNYVHHAYLGTGTGTGSGGVDRPVSYVIAQRLSSNSTSANIFGAVVMDILDYRNTNKFTTTRNLGGYDRNGAGQIYFESNLWKDTSAITSITIVTSTGLNFLANSHFALYGIKGA